MILSGSLTFINKALYNIFGFKHPLNLFLIQCICNLTICLVLMSWKSFVDPNGFRTLAAWGLRIPTLGETFRKLGDGLPIGAMYNVTIIFGIFAAKLVSIPMFLAFRRCVILYIIIVQYIFEERAPSSAPLLSLTLMVFGALLAGQETFDANVVGYLLIFGNNLAQVVSNVVLSRINSDR